MNNQKIHICLVSAQLLANIIPILMDKPDKVILVSTKTMQDNGTEKRFKEILDDHQIKHESYSDMPSANMPEIYEYASTTSIEIQEKYPEAVLTLNATCGTKLMSQGFIEVMSEDATLIYTDTQHNKLEYLGKERKTSKDLDNVLDIKTYLKAYGANYKQALSDNQDWLDEIKQRKSLTKYLGSNAEKISGLISNLNYLINENALTEDGLLAKPTQYLNTPPRKDWAAALKELTMAGVIEWEKGTEIKFIDEEKARYISGIWLEEYAYHLAKDESPNGLASGVKISWDNSTKTHNELDLVMVHNNRMLIMECKTVKFGKNKQKDTDILYKIDSLGESLKGLYGEIWLVNSQDAHSDMRDRAKDRRITIIDPSDLKQLRQKIRTWMTL